MADYGKALKRPFSDIKNLIIGIALSILPVVRWFSLGYILKNSGVTKEKIDTSKLQDWDNWGDIFIKGLLATAIKFLYILPALIILLIGAGTAIFSIMSDLMAKNIITKSTLESLSSGGDAAMNAFMQKLQANLPMMMPGLIKASPVIIFAILLSIFLAYLIPIAVLNYVKTSNFADAFNFGEVTDKAFTFDYFAVWVITLIISVFIALIFSLIPYVGGAIAFFCSGVFSYTAIGEVYKGLK